MINIPLRVYAIIGFASLGVMAAIALWPVICRVWDRSSRFARGVFCAFSICAALFGGAKHGTITYPRTSDFDYFIDADSYLTNDVVHLNFTVSPVVPTTADFRVDACETQYTNDEQIAEHTFSIYTNTIANLPARPFELTLVNATNYNVAVYSTWVPSSSKTNGVAEVAGLQCGATNKFGLIRTGYYVDGVKVNTNLVIRVPDSLFQSPSGGSNE